MYRLNKALYGLKQASKEWNAQLHNSLVSTGFEQNKEDPALYVLKEEKTLIFSLVYLHDALISSNV